MGEGKNKIKFESILPLKGRFKSLYWLLAILHKVAVIKFYFAGGEDLCPDKRGWFWVHSFKTGELSEHNPGLNQDITEG